MMSLHQSDKLILLIILSSCIILPITGVDYKRQRNLVLINQDNFEVIVNNSKHFLLLFYSQTSKQSIDLMQTLQKLAPQVIKKGVEIGKCDAKQEEILSDRNQIYNYPTLLFFKNGKAQRYTGTFKSSLEIITWIERRMGFPSTAILSPTQLERLGSRKDNSTTNVIYYDKGPFNSDNENLLKYFKTASIFIDDTKVNFYHVDVEKITPASDIQLPFIRMVRPDQFKKKVVEYYPPKSEKISLDMDEIYKFVLLHSEDDVIFLDENSSFKLFMYELETVLIFTDSKYGSQENQSLVDQNTNKIVKDIAQELRGKIRVVVSGRQKQFEQNIAHSLGIDILRINIPFMVLFDFPPGQDMRLFYLQDYTKQQFCLQSANNFIKAYYSNQLKQHIKSQSVDGSNTHIQDSNNLQKLVGDTFIDFVSDTNKVNVVMFDHHQCELCNKVRDFMKSLSEYFSEKYEGKIKFGVINSAYNEIPGKQPYYFPAIWIFPEGNEERILEYDRGDSVVAFQRFLIEQKVIVGEVENESKKEDLKEDQQKNTDL